MNTQQRHDLRVVMDKLEFMASTLIQNAENGIIITKTESAGAYQIFRESMDQLEILRKKPKPEEDD